MVKESGALARWLEDFGGALERGDVAAATALFAEDCYWRDLVAFTWNISTAEGRPAIADMLTATLAKTKPAAWKIEGTPKSADESWITFETTVGRGRGALRLKDGKCTTLFTLA